MSSVTAFDPWYTRELLSRWNSGTGLGSSDGTQWTSITGCRTDLTSYLQKLHSEKK